MYFGLSESPTNSQARSQHDLNITGSDDHKPQIKQL